LNSTFVYVYGPETTEYITNTNA